MNRDRNTLKGFFIKGAIPSQENFADLIDSAINQFDDGISKLPNDPLRINASGPDGTVLNFYQNRTDAKPTWTLKLNDSKTATLGWNVSDGEGISRLFIDGSSGKVGIGTTVPLNRLHVVGPGDFGGENADGTSGPGSVPIIAQGDGTVFGIINAHGRQAFALRIEGNNATSDQRGVPIFHDKYDGKWHASLVLKNGNVGIRTTNPQRGLQIGDDPIGISFDPGTSPNAGVWRFGDNTGWKLHFGRSRESSGGALNSSTQGLLMTIQDNGDVGIGTHSPVGKLDIQSAPRTGHHPTGAPLYVTGNIGPSDAGIEFRHSDGTRGIGFGWESIYRVGTGATQHLNLIPRGDGCVGIGTTQPGAKLHVADGILHVAGFKDPVDPKKTKSAYNGWGAYLGCNALDGKTGETDIINNKGMGTGGFAFINSDLPNRPLMFITGDGKVGIGGGIRATKPDDMLDVFGRVGVWDRLDVHGELFQHAPMIPCNGKKDWTTDKQHPLQQYFREKLANQAPGTMLCVMDDGAWAPELYFWIGCVCADKTAYITHVTPGNKQRILPL